MGIRCYFSLLLVYVCVVSVLVTCHKGFTVCDIPECICSSPYTSSWKNITCNLHKTQSLSLEETNIPKDSMEIFISGGEELKFFAKTFNDLAALTLVHIEGTKRIIMGKKTFLNVISASLLIEVKGCDELTIKTGAFENIQSSVSTEITNIDRVTLEQGAFSKLFNTTYKSIRNMILSEGSFDFKNQGTVGRHGPVTIILFDDVYIPKIPRDVFMTALASLTFRNSRIGDLETDSFKATEISALLMVNTTVAHIHEKAFRERMLICDFKISKCNITKLHTDAIVAAFENFSLSYSNIMDIESRAIAPTVAKVEVIGNYITEFHTSGFIFNKWNKITFDDNIILHVHKNFIETPVDSEVLDPAFSFVGNELHTIDVAALSRISELDDRFVKISDNFFNVSCDCAIKQWLRDVTNSTRKAMMNFNYCNVNSFLSNCYSIPIGVTNIRNFTETACINFTVCETKQTEETNLTNETNKFFLQPHEVEKQNWLIVIIVAVAMFLVAILITFVILLIRGGRWLKRKGYFRNVTNNDSQRMEEENTIVTDDENEKLKIPEELTVEFLQELSKRLDDPKTHQEASEIIEQLYEMFVVEESYENNNRQDEEAHLYEELGNLNLQIGPPPYEEERYPPQHSNGPRSILKLMEEKFNVPTMDKSAASNAPALAGDYSEPTDAAVHLYSELKHKIDKGEGSKGSLATASSSSSSKDVARQRDNTSIFEAGPSCKP